MNKPTNETYSEFQTAYDFFNRVLFQNQIPDCLITYQRKSHSKGYFADSPFVNNKTGKTIDELALNPDFFVNGQDKEVLSTLVHEMCHTWQKYCGKPGRGRYHNREWADKMLSIGLKPISIGGKRDGTGDRVTHSIIPGGNFVLACNDLIEKLKLTWVNRYASNLRNEDEEENQGNEVEETKKPVNKNKIKYTCPCGQNAWGKPDLNLICGDCKQPYQSLDN